jgi:sugar phosphate isomerase/epimerase
VRALLDGLDSTGLAASIDPAWLIQHGHDPLATTRALGPWVAHAYACDATASPSAFVTSQARRAGFPSGMLDWEDYLGALEEVNYRGSLTVWPDPAREPGPQFSAVVDRLKIL